MALFCFSTLMGQQMNKILYYSHLYLESRINGKTAWLIFDTGSPYTCIDSTFVADSNLQYNRIVEGRMGGAGNNQETVRVILNELTYTVSGQEYVSNISPIIQLKPIVGDYADGILGIDNMGKKVITIDYLEEQMAFEDRLGNTEGYTSIPIRYENNRIYVPLTIAIEEGKIIEGEGLIDLGSGGSVELTSLIAQEYALKDITPQIRYSTAVGGIGGEASGCYFRAKSASVGGFTLNDIVMGFSYNTGGSLASKEYIGIVGNDFWEHFDMIIDLPGARLFLRPNAKFKTPFDSPVRGFSYTDRSRTLGCWVVNCLSEESNAEKAGLRNGDHIVAVNGRDVKGISLEERKNFFNGMTEITLTIQRDTETIEISFPFDEPKL
jgi:membrane-associated protease RseP (regulator of RpoE activity)